MWVKRRGKFSNWREEPLLIVFKSPSWKLVPRLRSILTGFLTEWEPSYWDSISPILRLPTLPSCWQNLSKPPKEISNANADLNNLTFPSLIFPFTKSSFLRCNSLPPLPRTDFLHFWTPRYKNKYSINSCKKIKNDKNKIFLIYPRNHLNFLLSLLLLNKFNKMQNKLVYKKVLAILYILFLLDG